jgi:mRNA interferase MazF
MSVNAIGRLPLRIVVPLTDWQPTFRQFPWFTPVPATPQNGLTKDSGADVFQVKSVSNTRLIRRLGSISDQQAYEIASAISLCVGTP